MPFKLIPVVDLLGGQVVRAVRGDRANYRPIESALCPGSDAIAIVGALTALFPFSELYIADLDAIQRCGSNSGTIAAIQHHFPQLQLWVDAGIADRQSLANWQGTKPGRPVIGSECLEEGRMPCAATADVVLSLDFRGEHFAGPESILTQVSAWPADVIAMTLARVGSALGPDIDRLQSVIQRADGRRVFAAGGVRDAADLDRLRDCGAAGVLVASALHDRRIGPAELARHG